MKEKRIEFGKSKRMLGFRKVGADYRNRILKYIDQGYKVIFDFENVSIISHSFADECFGALLEHMKLDELKLKTTFVNTNKETRQIIKFVIDHRNNLELA